MLLDTADCSYDSHISESAHASHISDTDVDKLGWKQIGLQSSAPFMTGTSKRPGLRVELWCGVLKSSPECLTWQWIWCKPQPEARGREVRGIVMWDNRVNSECRSLLPLWPTFLSTRPRAEHPGCICHHHTNVFVQLSGARQILTLYICMLFFFFVKCIEFCLKKTLKMCLEADNFILSFDSRNFSLWGAGDYYRCDCIFKEQWVSDVWLSSFPAAQPVSSKLHDGWWAYKDVVQGSFIPGKPFKLEKKQCENMQNVSCQESCC